MVLLTTVQAQDWAVGFRRHCGGETLNSEDKEVGLEKRGKIVIRDPIL